MLSANLPHGSREIEWLPEPSTSGCASGPVRRDAFPGLMIALMLAASIVHGLVPAFPGEIGVLAAWVAGAAVRHRLPARVRIQVGAMLGVGLACLAVVAANGGAVEWSDALGRSLPILTLLAGVAFLRLIYRAEVRGGEDSAAPRGFGAYLRTMAGVHLFGAVINMSALVVFADRLARAVPLARREVVLLGRSYSMVAFYSPFIGGVALALGLLPEARFPVLMLAGVVLSCIGFPVIAILGRLEEGGAIAEFHGYPFRPESLWLPLALVSAVAAVHWTWPALPVLLAVALLAPLLAAGALAVRLGPAGAGRTVGRFTLTELPGMSGELTLFLAAGVLGGGLTAIVAAWPSLVPAFPLTPGAALVALAGIVVPAVAGVHPLVSVTALVAVALPASPDPTLLAAVCVIGWGLGSTVGPYSGINLVLAARCGVSSWMFVRWNAVFCAVMFLAAGAMFAGYGALIR